MARLGWLAVLLTVLAGCSDPAAEADPRARLADFRGCHLQYPDGTAVDCSRDLMTEGMYAEAVPAAWYCLESFDGDDHSSTVELWRNPDGHAGIRYEVVRTPLKAVPMDGRGGLVGVFELAGQDSTERLVKRLVPDRFLFMDTQLNAGWTGSWIVTVYEFWVNSDVSFLRGENLRTKHVGDYAGSPWFIWEFKDGPESYYFQGMGSFTNGSGARWTPVGFAVTGMDFHLTIDGWLNQGPSIATVGTLPLSDCEV